MRFSNSYGIAFGLVAYLYLLGDPAWAGAYRRGHGLATQGGVDNRTFVNTPVWAELVMHDGLAAELLVSNKDPKYAIYVSGGVTGHDEIDMGTGHVGLKVSPGATVRLPITVYQNRKNPLKEAELNYEYFDLSLRDDSNAPRFTGTPTGNGRNVWVGNRPIAVDQVTPTPSSGGGYQTPEARGYKPPTPTPKRAEAPPSNPSTRNRRAVEATPVKEKPSVSEKQSLDPDTRQKIETLVAQLERILQTDPPPAMRRQFESSLNYFREKLRNSR